MSAWTLQHRTIPLFPELGRVYHRSAMIKRTKDRPPAKVKLPEYMTQASAAKEAGVSRTSISRAVDEGRIEFAELGDGTPLIVRASFEKYMRERAAPKPKKKATPRVRSPLAKKHTG